MKSEKEYSSTGHFIVSFLQMVIASSAPRLRQQYDPDQHLSRWCHVLLVPERRPASGSLTRRELPGRESFVP